MNLGGAGGLFDNEFILGRAAGIGAGAHYHRPQVGDEPFLLVDNFFVQRRGGQVPMDRGDVSDAMMLQVFLHVSTPCFLDSPREIIR